jgi:hypothetical protein
MTDTGHGTEGERKATQTQWACGHSLTAPRANASPSHTCALPFWGRPVFESKVFTF